MVGCIGVFEFGMVTMSKGRREEMIAIEDRNLSEGKYYLKDKDVQICFLCNMCLKA